MKGKKDFRIVDATSRLIVYEKTAREYGISSGMYDWFEVKKRVPSNLQPGRSTSGPTPDTV
ncbi:MAG: hypothetical protein PHF64_08670 [Methanoregula sp.]|nr:hypothetical protein [Methanoregula sp.]